MKIGLVDEIGGMDDALKYAAKLGKVKEYRTQSFPIYEKNFKDFLGNMGIPFVQSKEDFIREEVGVENYETIQKIRSVTAKKGVQAAMPFTIDIR